MGLAHKRDDDVVRIGGVADGVRSAEQHLKADVGNPCAKVTQALPGVFVKKTHGGVKGSAAPHLDAEQIGEPFFFLLESYLY